MQCLKYRVPCILGVYVRICNMTQLDFEAHLPMTGTYNVQLTDWQLEGSQLGITRRLTAD